MAVSDRVQVNVRMPRQARWALERRARQENRTVSNLVLHLVSKEFPDECFSLTCDDALCDTHGDDAL